MLLAEIGVPVAERLVGTKGNGVEDPHAGCTWAAHRFQDLGDEEMWL